MNVQRGDVVLVDFPYALGVGSKVRSLWGKQVGVGDDSGNGDGYGTNLAR